MTKENKWERCTSLPGAAAFLLAGLAAGAFAGS